nr:FAD-dependent monooxygenase [Priestia megaterium]
MLKSAIVIGGSVAGKLAAKALSRYCQKVIILEAGPNWEEKTPRKRVPQTYHPHVLLKGGEEAIEELFPCFLDNLIADGGIINNFTRDLKWHHFGFWKQRFTGELVMVQQSRPLLEWHLLQRINQVENIEVKYETRVEQLLANERYSKVTGVKVKYLQTQEEESITADLVVDASGFGSRNMEWLKPFRIHVKEEKIAIKLFYATQYFRLQQEEEMDWCNLLISPSFPENPYGAFIQSVEGGRFSITFSGYANEQPPKTEKAFHAYAKKIPVPDVAQFLEKTQPISEINIHKIPYQVWRRFDLANVPAGLLVVGDAHCRFDPVFGQGISVAAMEALALQSCLADQENMDHKFNKAFHRRIAKLISTPWDMATTEVLRHPDIKGERSIILPFKQWYTRKIYELSAIDPDIYLRLVKVMNLLQPPMHLFHPTVGNVILKNKIAHKNK